MKKIAILIFCCIFSNILCAQTAIKIDPSEFAKINAEVAKEVTKDIKPSAPPAQNMRNSNAKVSLSCKDNMGRVFTNTDPGYQECLASISHQQNMKELSSPSANETREQQGSETIINLNLGN